MEIEAIDHIVITVANIDTSLAFYTKVLGLRMQSFSEGRVALHFGTQKINLHRRDEPVIPKANQPLPGSFDLCFVSSTPLNQVLSELQRKDVAIELGPVARTGACGAMQSIYIRDPDLNLIEICCY